MRDVAGFKRQYAVTREGRVWSYKTDRFLSTQITYSGYERVTLRNSNSANKATSFLVHRLVAKAYVPNILNLKEVHHDNAVRSDNSFNNLSWVTRSQNNQAAWDCGNKKFIWNKKHSDSVKRSNAARTSKKVG